MPEWLEQGSQQAVGLARDIATRQYTPYTGQRVAGLSAGERRAQQLANNTEGADIVRRSGDVLDELHGNTFQNTDLDRARSRLEASDVAFDADRYMNPYIRQVLDPQLRELNENYSQQLADLRGNAARVSAFGGERATMLESQLEREHNRAVAETTGKTMAAAYQQARQDWQTERAEGRATAEGYGKLFGAALDAWRSDNERLARVADAWRQTGGDISRMNREQIQDLMVTGGVGRLVEQAGLDFDYQQFVENRDWSVSNLDPLLRTLSTVPHGVVTTTEGEVHQTSTTKQSGNALGQVLGAVTTVAAAYFTGGGSLALKGTDKG